jgi:hypothetical protein
MSKYSYLQQKKKLTQCLNFNFVTSQTIILHLWVWFLSWAVSIFIIIFVHWFFVLFYTAFIVQIQFLDITKTKSEF